MIGNGILWVNASLATPFFSRFFASLAIMTWVGMGVGSGWDGVEAAP